MKHTCFYCLVFCLAGIFVSLPARAAYLLVAMDGTQKNHLKAYGMTFWVLQRNAEAEWLLNYRGGSFMYKYLQAFENELIVRGVSYEVLSDAQAVSLKEQIIDPEANMDVMKLEVAPKIAVYSPKSKQPWDDAVTLVLTYAEIPYTTIFDTEILENELPKYDWLHLHHEDFTGQFGKMFRSSSGQTWYQAQLAETQALMRKYSYKKASQLKLAVVKRMRDFCAGGGFLFAMCSASDTYDIALAADGVDICDEVYDGDAYDLQANHKLDFTKTFAFRNFTLELDPYENEYADIDTQPRDRGLAERNDFFKLFQFSAKWDPIPTMLTQNHATNIKGFMGQTTGFKKSLIKPETVIMGETKSLNEAKYIHGTFGKGTWTFYGGHDPEDYMHMLNEAPTDLNLHPSSPGYRLILNNILFPAAKKKKQKT